MVNQITVGQYQQLYAIEQSNDDPFDKRIKRVSVLTGKAQWEVEEMPLKEMIDIDEAIIKAFTDGKVSDKPVSFLKAGKHLYQVYFDASKIKAGQYVELQHWLKGNIIENLHLILASIVFPVKKYLWVKLPQKNNLLAHKEVAQDMLSVNFSQAYGCVVFFCKLFSVSIKAIQGYLELEMKKKNMSQEQARKITTDLQNVLDGFIPQSG